MRFPSFKDYFKKEFLGIPKEPKASKVLKFFDTTSVFDIQQILTEITDNISGVESIYSRIYGIRYVVGQIHSIPHTFTSSLGSLYPELAGGNSDFKGDTFNIYFRRQLENKLDIFAYDDNIELFFDIFIYFGIDQKTIDVNESSIVDAGEAIQLMCDFDKFVITGEDKTRYTDFGHAGVTKTLVVLRFKF